MKKIIALALIAFFMAGGIALAGPPLSYSGDVMGQNKYPGDPHRVFRLVHVEPCENDTDGLAAGDVVVWSDHLDDGVSVETTTTSGDSRVAGILATTIASDDTSAGIRTATEDSGKTANWGWLQTYGKSAVNPSVGTVAAGDKAVTAGAAICASATAGTVTNFNAQLSTTNAGILGCALDAIAVSNSGEVFITRD